MPKPRVTIVGLGCIGGSLGLSLKKANADWEIVGHDKEPRVASQAQKRGAVDRTDWNLLNACNGAGLIVLALPLGAIRETLSILKRELSPGVIVTDTAYAKAPVLEWAGELPNGVHFIGGDPIIPAARASSNVLGIESADANLFQDATYCLTPAPSASGDAINVLTDFVALLGAKPMFLDAAEHDGLIAGAQHLAYILSATLLRATSASDGWRDLRQLAGRDYFNATTLAARDPMAQSEMWLNQRVDLVRWIDVSIETLTELRESISSDNAVALENFCKQIANAREEWLAGKVGALPAMPDPGTMTGMATRMLLGGLAPRGGKKK